MSKLVKSSYDRKLMGVCGGIANYLGWDANIVRVAWVLLTVLSVGAPMVIAYVLMGLFMPEEY